MTTSCYGWIGKHIRVDLTRGDVTVHRNDHAVMKTYLGSRGIGIKILMDEIDPIIDAAEPINRLIIATGPLTGIPPAGNRCYFITKSPLTGGAAIAGVGGDLGGELKFAGYDFVVIHGKSARPVYLWIHDDDIRLIGAEHLWGLDTRLTEKVLLKETDLHAQIAAIEAIGENLVRSSTGIAADSLRDHMTHRIAVGGVMGAKNLKAMVVRGTHGIKIADPVAFKANVQNVLACLADQTDFGADGGKRILKKDRARWTASRRACLACPWGYTLMDGRHNDPGDTGQDEDGHPCAATPRSLPQDALPLTAQGINDGNRHAIEAHVLGFSSSSHAADFCQAAFDCSEMAATIRPAPGRSGKDISQLSDAALVEMIKDDQNYRAWAHDALGCCCLLMVKVDLQDITAILESVTGEVFGNADDLNRIGKRIFTLERLFSRRAGLSAKSDIIETETRPAASRH